MVAVQAGPHHRERAERGGLRPSLPAGAESPANLGVRGQWARPLGAVCAAGRASALDAVQLALRIKKEEMPSAAGARIVLF